MKSVFAWFRRRFKKWYRPDANTQKMLRVLATMDEHEISCEEVSAVIHHFTDAVHRGENVLLFTPLIRQHLDVCPACREEYEVLLGMLQPEHY